MIHFAKVFSIFCVHGFFFFYSFRFLRPRFIFISLCRCRSRSFHFPSPIFLSLGSHIRGHQCVGVFLMAGNRIIKHIRSIRVDVRFHLRVLFSARFVVLFYFATGKREREREKNTPKHTHAKSFEITSCQCDSVNWHTAKFQHKIEDEPTRRENADGKAERSRAKRVVDGFWSKEKQNNAPYSSCSAKKQEKNELLAHTTPRLYDAKWRERE